VISIFCFQNFCFLENENSSSLAREMEFGISQAEAREVLGPWNALGL
jgi:hypothetical protein